MAIIIASFPFRMSFYLSLIHISADSEYYYADTEGLIADLKAGTDPEDSHFIVYLNEDGEVYDILENANWAVSGGVVDTVNTSTGRVSYDSTFVANDGGRTQTNFKDCLLYTSRCV